MTDAVAGAAGRSVRVAGARIAGVVSALPSRKVTNDHFVPQFGEQSVADVTKMTGVTERYWSGESETTADLCLHAARRLLDRLGWQPEDVGALVFVTQTPDYRLPATACVLQAQLGLGPACAAFDINLGCSGYTYGLWVAMSLAVSSGLKRALLLVGDTISKTVAPDDRSTALLFGDAGTATAIELSGPQDVAHFVLGTDGAGARNLVIPRGAFRSVSEPDARMAGRNDTALFMDGGEIFNFTLQAVPKLVNQSLADAGVGVGDVDAFLFHQANLFMLKHLAKKLKIPAERFPTNIERFGNTSSATIPLLITTNLAKTVAEKPTRVAMAGFGVGYSWGAALLTLGPLACVETISV